MRVSPVVLAAVCGAILCVPPSPVAAQMKTMSGGHGSDISIGVRGGTLGVGGEIAKLVNSHIGLRVGANFISHTFSKSQSDIDFDVTLKFKGVSGLVDLFPSARGSFHFTGGIMSAPADVAAVGKPTGTTYTINDVDYTAAQVGTLTGTAKWPSASAYAGLGWGTPAARHGALKLVFDLGAVFGKPTIAMNATGAAASQALASDINAQVAKTQKDVDKYAKVYPVISLGLVYRF